MAESAGFPVLEPDKSPSLLWPAPSAMLEQIEKLKQEFTDKYVVVEDNVPELARFGGHVGQVKTVNMNGRALVQFEAWNNIGWYDIELECLRVVPKPDPAATEAKKQDAKKDAPRPAAKPAATTGEKKLSPLEMARMQGAAKPAGAPAAGAKKSTADILAAARANKDSAPAAAKPAGKPSTADILAAARAKAAPAAEPMAAEEAAAETAAPVAAAPAQAAKSAGSITLKPGERPSVPVILAWCREHDSN